MKPYSILLSFPSLCLYALCTTLFTASLINPGKLVANLLSKEARAEPVISLSERIKTRIYRCYDRNITIPVTYIKTGDNHDYAVMQVEGKQIAMIRENIEPNGTKTPRQHFYYLSIDEQNSYRWYPDGNKAALKFLAADDSARVETVYKACQPEENSP